MRIIGSHARSGPVNATEIRMAAEIPAEGFLRLKQIIGDKKAGIPPIIPVSATTWWEGLKTGRFPRPVKLGPRTTVWRAADIRRLVNSE